MSQIETLHAREILDSRGNPTVEVDVALSSGGASAAPRCRRAPPPASTRRVELRDGDKKRYGGKGVLAGGARTSTTSIADAIAGLRRARPAPSSTARCIELDGTPNKSRLGANAILGVSLAVARGGRGRRRPAAVPLPRRRRRRTCCRCR